VLSNIIKSPIFIFIDIISIAFFMKDVSGFLFSSSGVGTQMI
jgi:hypothetical protein